MAFAVCHPLLELKIMGKCRQVGRDITHKIQHGRLNCEGAYYMMLNV